MTRDESGVDVEDFVVTASPQDNKIRLSLQLKSLTEEEIYAGKTIEGLTIELGIKYGNEIK
ncbi:MAG: hypothetical protein MJ195_02790 [Mycoplasmoidaceae bacterium]|nr:hypothetical protein [Mycoplasmoidaceae bacterium]